MCFTLFMSNGENPFSAQSSTLAGSNIRGAAAEREVRRITGGEKADLAYATTLGYDCNIDADCVLNRGTARELILTVTHCNPSSPRQSLENKFQNKLGEMWLWKTHDHGTSATIRVLIAVECRLQEHRQHGCT